MIDVQYTMKRAVYIPYQQLRFEQSATVPAYGNPEWPRTVRIYMVDDGGNKTDFDTRSMEQGDDDLPAFAVRYVETWCDELREAGLI